MEHTTESRSDKPSSPKKDLNGSPSSSPRSKEKEVITPTLKIEARSPRVQQLTISSVENKAVIPSTPFQKRSPPNLKRAVTFKDPRHEIEVKSSSRVFPSPRPSQMQVLNQLKKNFKGVEETRSVLFIIFVFYDLF